MGGYIIAGNAIYGTGATPEEALADYVKLTGDDSISLDTISRNPRDGHLYLMPCTDALLAKVDAVGGAISWDDLGDVADVEHEDE